MERWFVSSNCQTTGLANSFALLNEALEVESADIWTFSADIDRYCEAFDRFDRIVVGPEVRQLIPDAVAARHRIVVAPTVQFGAYHPDLTYIANGAEALKGPIDNYHSRIAFAGHRAGIGVERTLGFYNARAYRTFGYLDRWTHDRDALIAGCREHGIDVSLAIRRWGRQAAFMHSVDHPTIRVVHEIARLVLLAQGLNANGSDMLPHDNLLNGPCFPVYPEIGETLGVPGSYRFKPMAHYVTLGLRAFVEQSFAAFDTAAPGALFVSEDQRPLLRHMIATMEGQAA